jgi:hypothetical protein
VPAVAEGDEARAAAAQHGPAREGIAQRAIQPRGDPAVHGKERVAPLMTMMSAAARAAAISDAGGVRTATSSALTAQPTSAKPDVWLCIGAGSSYVAVPR